MRPRTHYARSGEVSIAYQVVGDGPIDLIYVPGWISHVEYVWESPIYARFLRRLASFTRLILFDKRGTGLSDRDVGFPTLEQRMDDVRAVMDAVGCARAALFGMSEGGSMSMLFAATYPERTVALVLFGAFARRLWAPDYSWAPTPEEREEWLAEVERDWGGPVAVDTAAPSLADDPQFCEWWATYLRFGASPQAAVTLGRLNSQIDMRDVLPAIDVPTLVLHRRDDRHIPAEHGRYLAAGIRGAKYVEVPGDDHLPFVGDQEALLGEIEEFLTGSRHGPTPNRVLATILFSDIVDSTGRAAAVGDARWLELLDAYHTMARRQIALHRGRRVKTTGDGFIATFDGPARAVRCGLTVREQARRLGLEVRTALHTGECELHDQDVAGIAVHIAARVLEQTGPGEILVSGTLKDLVVGSGLEFEPRGEETLRGIPGSWRLFAVTAG